MTTSESCWYALIASRIATCALMGCQSCSSLRRPDDGGSAGGCNGFLDADRCEDAVLMFDPLDSVRIEKANSRTASTLSLHHVQIPVIISCLASCMTAASKTNQSEASWVMQWH